MILPKELAQAFIEHIDLSYLKYYEISGDKENYLSSAESHMKNAFNISWSKGGTYGSCWSDELTEVYADEEPAMEELDKFLAKYYPNLTENEKNSIYSSVEENDDYDSDYYGGSTVEGKKSISFESLANNLISAIYNNLDNSSLDLIDFNELLEQHSNLVINICLADYPKVSLLKELNENLDNKKSSTKKLKI